MICNVNGYFPPDFFASARASNEYESLSERIVKAILCNLYDAKDDEVLRGNDKKDEPDYIVNGKGFEVTFGTPIGFIPYLQGKQKARSSNMFSEDEIIKGIDEAVSRKAQKRYACTGVTVVVLSIHPILYWYLNEPQSSIDENDLSLENMVDYMFPDVYQKAFMRKRNDCFRRLYSNFVKNGAFDDVLIMQSTFDSKYVIYSVKRFISNPNGDYKKLLCFRDPDKFAYYQVARCDDDNGNTIRFRYNFFVGKWGGSKNETTI